MHRKPDASERHVTTAWGSIALTPLVLSLLAFGSPGADPPAPPQAPSHAPSDLEVALDRLERRAAALERGLQDVDSYYHERVAPVERILRPFHEDEEWVRRVAFTLVAEADEVGMDPRALASVLLVENPWLEPGAESFMGAVGLMQVMPLHAGNWGCASADLRDLSSNICHGARIFAHYLERSKGDVDRALLAYNGCVNGTNTPDCHSYPSWVYSRAGRAAMQRWLPTDD